MLIPASIIAAIDSLGREELIQAALDQVCSFNIPATYQ
jgi:hypothetical protein